MKVELPAYLWCKEFPGISFLDDPKYNMLYFSLVNLINVIYAGVTNFDEPQRVEAHYDVLMRIAEVGQERDKLIAIAKQGMRSYGGPHDRWEWAASRATVMPPNSSLRFFQALMLGRGVDIKDQPEIIHGPRLAAVLATHARRAVHPEPYGEGGEIPRELVETFWEETAQIFNDKILSIGILDQYNLGAEDIAEARKQLIRFAAKSVPRGLRGQTKRDLEVRLRKD